MRVAVTRALPDAERTAARVRELGAEALVAPLLRIEAKPFDPNLSGVQALLFTSTNGVRAFAQATPGRAPRVLAVGDATAEAARGARFGDVRSADGDGAALAALARVALDPKAGRVVHISGAHVAGDIVGALAAAGFEAERRVAYEAVGAATLPAAFSPGGETGLDLVLFHSARAAEVFTAFGAPNAKNLTAACLSPVIAKVASVSPWKQIIVASAPREDALLHAALGGKNI